MSAEFPTWPCRHDPPCYSEAQHWEVSGFEYPENGLNDPVCRDCGEPGQCCTCNDDDADEHRPLVRDEVVVKLKPGYVVVQVSEESLRVLRQFVQKCTCMCRWVGEAKTNLADVLKEDA
jgi:hypothetical protein